MAGARVTITKNTASPALKKAMREMQGDGRAAMLEDMGELLVLTTRERQEREVSPDGSAWRALSPAYKRYKQKKRPGVKILKFDFHMMGDQFSFQVAADALYVGTNAPYGAVHQFGHTFERKARTQDMHFRRGDDGKVGTRFVPRSKSNVTRKANVPEHQIVIPARPWLGLSQDDGEQMLTIAAKHLRGMFTPD